MKATLELKTGDSPYDVTMTINGNDILKLLPVSQVTLDIAADHNPELTLRIPIDNYVVNAANINPAKVVAGDITVSKEALQAFINQLQETLE